LAAFSLVVFLNKYDALSNFCGLPLPKTGGNMRMLLMVFWALALVGCAVPTTGVIPRTEGNFTVTRQGNGFWVQSAQLTNDAILEGVAYCEKSAKKFKQVHVKEDPGRSVWPVAGIGSAVSL
jgi:hypothetical protein